MNDPFEIPVITGSIVVCALLVYVSELLDNFFVRSSIHNNLIIIFLECDVGFSIDLTPVNEVYEIFHFNSLKMMIVVRCPFFVARAMFL